MTRHSLISLLGFWATLLLIFTLPNPSLGSVATIIHPADANDSMARNYSASGYLDINSGRNPVYSNENYSHTASILVDQSNGSIKGYAGYNLDTPRSVTCTSNFISTISGTNEPALVSNVNGTIIYDTIISGPAGVVSSATVSIDINGSFNYLQGNPSMGLGGGVSIYYMQGGGAYNSHSFSLSGEYANFNRLNVIPDANNVFGREDFQVLDASGNPIPGFTSPDVTSNIQYISMDPNNLSMRVSLNIPIQAGDRWLLNGFAFAGASHALLDDYTQINPGDPINVAAAEGYVDFSNTATMGIVLPDGFSLGGADAPPQSIITTSQVPLPGAAWLLFSGLIGISVLKKRRIKSPV